MKIKGYIFKAQSYSFFRSDCQKCPQVNRCISATGLVSDNLDYVLRLKGYRKIETEAMRKGKELHREALATYKTVDDLGIKTIRNELLSGRELTLSEVPVCSRLYGLKGVIDLLRMRLVKQKFTVDIYDIKPALNSKYIIQVAVYGLILSDNDFEIVYKSKKKRLGMKILPDIPLKKNINIYIVEPKKQHKIEFIKNNKFTKKGAGYKAYICRLMKEKRKFHKFGIWLVAELDKNVKERQLFFGIRKLLKKSKPVVKL